MRRLRKMCGYEHTVMQCCEASYACDESTAAWMAPVPHCEQQLYLLQNCSTLALIAATSFDPGLTALFAFFGANVTAGKGISVQTAAAATNRYAHRHKRRNLLL